MYRILRCFIMLSPTPRLSQIISKSIRAPRLEPLCIRRQRSLSRETLPPIVWLVRLLVGAYPRWVGSAPTAAQRIYFANHTSHMDTIVLWAALPRSLRANTRPVAAKRLLG